MDTFDKPSPLAFNQIPRLPPPRRSSPQNLPKINLLVDLFSHCSCCIIFFIELSTLLINTKKENEQLSGWLINTWRFRFLVKKKFFSSFFLIQLLNGQQLTSTHPSSWFRGEEDQLNLGKSNFFSLFFSLCRVSGQFMMGKVYMHLTSRMLYILFSKSTRRDWLAGWMCR